MMKRTGVLICSLLLMILCCSVNEASNIALFTLIGSLSQKNSYNSIAAALVKRGHNVTIFTIFPSPDKMEGLTEIYFKEEGKYVTSQYPSFLSRDGPIAFEDLLSLIYVAVDDGCKIILKTQIMQDLKQRKDVFDVSVVDTIFHDCFLPLIDHVSKLIVYYSTLGMPNERSWYLGVPNPPYVPSMYSRFNPNMTFLQRAENAFEKFMIVYDHETHVVPNGDIIAQELTPGLASVREIENRIPLLLLNSHPATDYPAPSIPMAKNVGGLHLKPAKRLPPNIERFISESGDKGFIFVSFGTMVQDENMPLYAKEAFVKAFARIPYRVVWKFTEKPAGLTPNVMIVDYAPQNDLLGDPRIKAFITHGGVYSYMESIYHGVPLVGVPVMADQPYNVARAKHFGIATSLSWDNMTADDVVQALDDVINNPSYKKNIVERQKLLRDNAIHPLDEAVYWIEYVIRHKGSLHMRLPVGHLNIAQYLLLDVIGLILGGVLGLMFVLYKLIGLCGGRMRPGTTTSPKNKKQ